MGGAKGSKYGAITPSFVASLKATLPSPAEQLFWRHAPEDKEVALEELEMVSMDRSHHSAGAPELVVYASCTEDIARVLPLCSAHRVPVTTRTTGTGLEGGSIPSHGGVVLSLFRMNKILDFNEEELMVTVQPAVRKSTLNKWLAKKGFFFPVDPGSDAGLGGYTSTGASGTLSVK